MRKSKKGIKIYFSAVFTFTAVLACLVLGAGMAKIYEAYAAENSSETVEIRIIGTTDLHGQLNSKDYEQGVDYNNGGLARVKDLITKTRNELPKENTFTLDVGDVLFDYTTEYIFSENQEAIQPIYSAMAEIGYDAITLGNHDFDYGYDYIQRQLNASGLRDITIVSNVTDAKTGEHPFLENMLITRTMKTSSGKEVEVTVGIIGQTIPTLTGKTHSYAGILKGEDLVLNAAAQASKLKEMGADIIIALSHTGIGPENPELNFKNAAYALTKIPEIDVVVCGHEHNLYPTTDMTSPYYKLPEVDKETSLMNGKNVIMAGDRGEAIGVVDLTVSVDEDRVKIVDRSSKLRMVTEKTTVEDKQIAAAYGEWEQPLLNYSTDIIADLEQSAVIQNFYGLMGDNMAMQLLNDSKIHYALHFSRTGGKQYQGYPIIAASTYASYGINSVQDFVNIRSQITESDLSTIQPYNNYLYIYTITGKQLKEWLEWTASAYETLYLSQQWKHPMMSSLMKSTGLRSLIREEWLDDWSSFYVFDGIDYVIDPAKAPRYDISGNRISTSSRVSQVEYQGKPVTDDMVLLLATNKITIPTEANRGVEKQVALNGFIRSQSVLGKYMKQLSQSGSILPQVDYNWRVKLPSDYKFLMKVPAYADSFFENTPWYVEYLSEMDDYRYYTASYPIEKTDTTAPHILAAPLVTVATNSSFEVAVEVSDASELKYVKYATGEMDADYDGWAAMNNIPSKGFTVWANGTYTIYAEDQYGNRAVKQIVIKNFDPNVLSVPVIDTYTNRKSKISGTAEPNTIIVFETVFGKKYETKVNGSGNFSYALPSQLAGSKVYVHIEDKDRGLKSERVPVLVKRTGPNRPEIDPVYNNVSSISGNAYDTASTVIAIIDDIVYVSDNGGRQLYESNTEIYDESLKIVETNATVSYGGYFTIGLPPLEAGTTVTIYTLDHISRNSRVSTTTVLEAAPNAPVVYEVSNIEKSVAGYIPGVSGKTYTVELVVGSNTYTAQTDKNGRFQFELKDQLIAGEILKFTASDKKNGIVRKSYTTGLMVNNIKSYIKEDSEILVLNRLTDKSNLISGFYYDGGTVYVAIAKGEGAAFQNTLHMVETDFMDKYRYYLEEKLSPDITVYAMIRFNDGKILMAKKVAVLSGKPEIPELLEEVTNTDKKVVVAAQRECEVQLTIGSKTYKTKEYQYEEQSGKYLYSFVTDRDVSGTQIKVTVTNALGTSDELVSAVVKAAPDSPGVEEVKAGDKKITGKIELFEYESGTENGDAIPKEFKDAPEKVAKTQTRIYAQIGDAVYKGTISNKGKFTIEIPVAVEGTDILVWGTNKAGRGPMTKVTVVK